MRAVLQRVKSASVTVDGKLISEIGKGLLVLAAISRDDTERDIEAMAQKILKAKLWDDASKEPPVRWKLGIKDIGGEVLCVSQFTLHASLKKGAKPDFHQSANGLKAKTLYEMFFNRVQALYSSERVKDGMFAAMMDVQLINDGPVTIQIDTDPPKLQDPTSLGTPSASIDNMTKISKESAEPLE
ncbi:D-tyrosyl-tRNA deacylase-like protein [Westerdykella ornata]|uniref:D-aminoacyl-tRNA deacylase n=1 Tax=Westerdykella ornata TaxID=318751 RepID=A0A6A6JIY6_WESOR|nr:D-tyrosyl-tRNA deacylase-like protein [Westerdykella ornata]KAF2276620.1 D-tyrosyl-tRNA deacylase-like protein [Westerdykella ornata]